MNKIEAKNPNSDNICKPHPIFAGICDFYFSFYVLGCLLALVSTIFKVVIPVILLLALMPITITAIIVYYRKFAVKQKFLTPGEIIGGRIFVDGNKKWINLFNKNRFAFFTVILVNIIIYGNSWDFLFDGKIISITDWIVTTIIAGSVLVGTTLAGRGSKKWFKVLLLPNLINMIILFATKDKLSSSLSGEDRAAMLLVSLIIFVAIIVSNFFIYIFYTINKNSRIRKG